MKPNSNVHMNGTRESWTASYFDGIALAVVLALFIVYMYTTPKMEDYGSDTSIYIVTARNLLHDHRYWFNYEPHTTYPPGFPVLLAGFMAVVGESFSALVRIMPLFGFLGLIGIYFLVKLQMGSRTAFVVLLLLATSYSFYFFTTWTIASDAAYFMVTALVLLFFETGNRTEKKWLKVLSYLLVALLLIAAVLIRSIGIALIVGLFLWIVSPLPVVMRKRGGISLRRRIAWIPVVIVAACAFWGWTHWAHQSKSSGAHEDYMNSYEGQILKEDPHQIDSPMMTLGKIPERMLSMTISRAENAGMIIFNLPRKLQWSSPFVAVAIVLIIAGFTVSLIREGRLFDWYFLSYMGVLLLWPFDEGTRFLFPVQPLLYLYMVVSLKLVYEKAASEGLVRYYPHCLAVSIVMLIYCAVQVVVLPGGSKQDMISFGAWLLLCCIIPVLRGYQQTRGKSSGRDRASSLLPATREQRIMTTILGVALTVIIAAGAVAVFSQARRNLHPDSTIFRHKASDVQAAQWIDHNTLPTDRIMTDEYATLHRLTGRKTFRFPLVAGVGKMKEAIDNTRVEYIVVLNEKEYEYYNPSTMQRFILLKNAYPDMFEAVHEFEEGKIYRVL